MRSKRLHRRGALQLEKSDDARNRVSYRVGGQSAYVRHRHDRTRRRCLSHSLAIAAGLRIGSKSPCSGTSPHSASTRTPCFSQRTPHSKIRHVKGARSDAGTPEQGVLHALTASFGLPSENTVIAVTGASGSGKSHLVRWLRAHLTEDADRYHLIYVPRELATLRDLIGRVLDGMPPSPETDAVRDAVEKAVAKKPADQLAESLLDKLRSVVSYELPDATRGGPV